MTNETKEALLAYGWPGNVRQLRNVLERAAIVCDGGLIAPEHLSLDIDDRRGAAALASIRQGSVSGSGTTNVRTVERELVQRVLTESGGNKSRAAKRLGLTRKQLYVRLRQYAEEERP
jgi:DNA-binding NtrC family response regulator